MEKNDLILSKIRILLYSLIIIFSSIYTNYNIKIFLMILFFVLVLTEKRDNILPILLFIHPCLSIFDDISFTYTFNVTIFIFLIKLLISKDYYFSKKLSFLIIVLFLYEILLNLFGGYLSTSLFSLVSLFSSYLLTMFMVKNLDNIDLKKCLKYFFIGFTLGALMGIIKAYMHYGLNVPLQFRYMGLFRDPNYYSLDGLIIMFSSICIYKKISFEFVITFLFSVISVSKMFIIVSIIGVLSYFIINIGKIKTKNILAFILLIISLLAILNMTSLGTTISNKYQSRISNINSIESFSTGRSGIIDYYIKRVEDEPIRLFFGSSLSNYKLELADETNKYVLFVAHNSYLELFLSWGLIGCLLYFQIIKEYRNEIKKYFDSKKLKINSYESILIFAFLISIFALSLIGADIFIILIFYILLVVYYQDIKKVNK